MTTAVLTPAQQQFLVWLKRFNPRLFYAATKDAGQLPAGLGATATTQTSPWSSILNNLSTLGTTYLNFSNQQQILKTQLARAQQGLPPLNASQYTVPTQVQVGVSPQTGQQIAAGVTSGLKAYVLPLGVAAFGLVAVMAMKPKRGRR